MKTGLSSLVPSLSKLIVFQCFLELCLATAGQAGQPPVTSERFAPGSLKAIDQLPAGQLRLQLEQLPEAARERALGWLRSFHFTGEDLASLRADAGGGIFYVCREGLAVPAGEELLPAPEVGWGAVPVNPFPEGLIFHSRPGAPNVIYLNFSGATVTGTEWNTEVDRLEIPALAFSTDSDLTTFSDAEQVIMKRIWQRVAEDYAAFNVDVTTEPPASLTTRTAVALITRNTDANGDPNPFNAAAGVAYVNVFGTTVYVKYRPAWIYHNNLGNNESYLAEAVSHEIGHNMGLSHDGKTDGTEYYAGHGTGDTSWAPIMGVGYNRNVTHWSKGEYYLANNTQDDLATIAGKLAYRPDDHGNTPGTATALIPSDGTNIVATTPENDPANANPANKGVLERGTDLDVFSFVTGSGPVSLSVKPWIMPAGTRGGNVDLSVELYDEAGALLLQSNPASLTTALVQTNLAEGRYYLQVRNTGTGDPLSSPPSGYTSYSSLGQYFISGTIAEATGFVVPPRAESQIADLIQPGQSGHPITVTYSDNVAMDVSTIDANDIRVTGPQGYNRTAALVSVSATSDGTPRTATYSAPPPNGNVWSPTDNGTYTVWMESEAVGDVEGAWVTGGTLGEFRVAVPVAVYSANFDQDPGWALEPQWEYGIPSYTGNGPAGGFTGTKILGYNLSGNYANRLDPTYAITPPIDCSGSTILTLRFQRWLRLKPADTASLEVSIDGRSWIPVWSTSSAVSDTSWQAVQYTLPAAVTGSATLQLRWGLSSNPAQNEIGWNLDDVELLGDGALDTVPPAPSLSVADMTLGGAPSHSCAVTYTDDTAVRLASLDATDLMVTGPNGYSNAVEFVGADLPGDGSPMTGTYSIPAPGGSWEAGDNGTYTVTLLEAAVSDTVNNATPRAVLGNFQVELSTVSPGLLEVWPGADFRASGPVGGPFTPSSLTYTLTNSGGATLTWTAGKAQDWVDLSATAGTLTAGASSVLTVSLNDQAPALPPGAYLDTVNLVNTTSRETLSRQVQLVVSAFSLSLIRSESNPDQIEVILQGQPQQRYILESSLDLGAWHAVVTNAADEDGIMIYSDAESANAPARFYRARLESSTSKR